MAKKMMRKEIPKFKKMRDCAIKSMQANRSLSFPDITVDEHIKAYDAMMRESKRVHPVEFTRNNAKRWGGQYGRNILHLAAFFELPLLTAWLLQRKEALSSYNKTDDMGFTPLDYAETEGHKEIVRLIKEFEDKRVKKND